LEPLDKAQQKTRFSLDGKKIMVEDATSRKKESITSLGDDISGFVTFMKNQKEDE
jgi:hypothetical protein